MSRGEHCQMPSDWPGFRASVASPGCEKCRCNDNLLKMPLGEGDLWVLAYLYSQTMLLYHTSLAHCRLEYVCSDNAPALQCVHLSWLWLGPSHAAPNSSLLFECILTGHMTVPSRCNLHSLLLCFWSPGLFSLHIIG